MRAPSHLPLTVPRFRDEVGVAGTRVCKTDVGWIGDGYKYAFDGVALCASGIEDNADARRFIWTVEGWAGTHRNAVMWTGDDDGSYEVRSGCVSGSSTLV